MKTKYYQGYFCVKKPYDSATMVPCTELCATKAQAESACMYNNKKLKELRDRHQHEQTYVQILSVYDDDDESEDMLYLENIKEPYEGEW